MRAVQMPYKHSNVCNYMLNITPTAVIKNCVCENKIKGGNSESCGAMQG